jgi:hypothetical protein
MRIRWSHDPRTCVAMTVLHPEGYRTESFVSRRPLRFTWRGMAVEPVTWVSPDRLTIRMVFAHNALYAPHGSVPFSSLTLTEGATS